jgi:hypothetical protein
MGAKRKAKRLATKGELMGLKSMGSYLLGLQRKQVVKKGGAYWLLPLKTDQSGRPLCLGQSGKRALRVLESMRAGAPSTWASTAPLHPTTCYGGQ